MEGRDPQSGTEVQMAIDWIHLVERLTVCSRLLRAGLDARMAACDLNPSQFSILWVCYHAESGAGQSQLADLLAVSPAHVSGLVEQLRRRRLLAGHRPPSDRRRQLWRLTPQGRNSVESVLTAIRAWAVELDARLPAKASRALTHMVDQVTEAVQAAEQRVAAAGQKGAA